MATLKIEMPPVAKPYLAEWIGRVEGVVCTRKQHLLQVTPDHVMLYDDSGDAVREAGEIAYFVQMFISEGFDEKLIIDGAE